MDMLFEPNLCSYFIELLDIDERISLRQTCRGARASVPRQKGIRIGNISLQLQECLPPRGMSHALCNRCDILFDNLADHFVSFPNHNRYPPSMFHSWLDLGLGARIGSCLNELYCSNQVEVITRYGTLKICAPQITRGVSNMAEFVRRPLSSIVLNERKIYIINGRLYIGLTFDSAARVKLAAVLSVQEAHGQRISFVDNKNSEPH
jgi:hypothetical protein